MQILTKRIIVNASGKIINHELHSPFAYLIGFMFNPPTPNPEQSGSEQKGHLWMLKSWLKE